MKPKKRRSNTNLKVLHVAVQNKRQTQKTRRLAWWLGCGALAMLATGLMAHYLTGQMFRHVLYENNDFALQEVHIHNSGTINRAEILAWAGIERGQNVFTISLQQVKQRLEAMPYIAGVKVERSLPGTIRIHITERMPVAKLIPYSPSGNLLAQSVYYVDGAGYVMKPKEGERLKPLPEITGLSSDEFRVGEVVENREVLFILNLVKASSYYGLQHALDLRRIDVQPRGVVALRTRYGGHVRMRSDNLEEQARRLQVIFSFGQRNHKVIRTVDLTPSRNVPVTFM
ncbi:MAG: cell division protein FtsQ/DivIB [Candidatus Methylacidiphilales bacterium]